MFGRSNFARSIAVLLVLIFVFGVAGCAKKTVTRIDTDTTIDLSGRWNDADSRMVAEQVIDEITTAAWLRIFESQNNNERPTVIVGIVRNRTDEHIAAEVFTKDIEREFVNSGRVRVVANSSEREQLRDERSDQTDFSSAETVKKFGQEHGADFMLMGTMNKITDEEGGQKIVFYQIDLELTNIETNEKVFIGGKKHKKYIGKGKYKG